MYCTRTWQNVKHSFSTFIFLCLLLSLFTFVFVVSASKIFLPLRGRCLGCPEGLRRCLYAGVLRLFADCPTDGAVADFHQPATRPEPVGADGRVPGAGAVHLDVCGPGHHGPATQRERGNCHYGPRPAGREVKNYLYIFTPYPPFPCNGHNKL